jgi:Zn-dependent metalloprotease
VVVALAWVAWAVYSLPVFRFAANQQVQDPDRMQQADINKLREENAKYLALTPTEVAGVFYLALTQQLSRTSQFSDSRRGVLTSARTLFRTLPPDQQAIKLAAFTNGFTAVGIV